MSETIDMVHCDWCKDSTEADNATQVETFILCPDCYFRVGEQEGGE